MVSPSSHNTAATPALGILHRRSWLYAAWILTTCVVFFVPVRRFVLYSLTNDNASHAILIPAICGWLLFLERDRIFASLGSDMRFASAFLFGGVLVAAVPLLATSRLSQLNQISLYVFALLLFWAAGFAFLFGREALRQAHFPLAFSLFTIPIPDFLLEKSIYWLQKGSAEISAVLFDWTGVPVLRDGFVFHLAHVNIEIARECSGIRSSLALLILAVLVAHFYLRTFWKQAVLVLAGLFVMVLKNGVRIVTLTLLASYVNPDFLYGKLHHEGGVVFFLLGLALLAPLLWLLERSEPKSPASDARPARA
jgi:exosortase